MQDTERSRRRSRTRRSSTTPRTITSSICTRTRMGTVGWGDAESALAQADVIEGVSRMPHRNYSCAGIIVVVAGIFFQHTAAAQSDGATTRRQNLVAWCSGTEQVGLCESLAPRSKQLFLAVGIT